MSCLKAYSLIFLLALWHQVHCQATRQICITLPDSEDDGNDFQFVDYDRITEGIKSRISQVMDKWKTDMAEQFENLGENIESDAQENFAAIKENLGELIFNNKTGPCRKDLPINRDDLPPELCEVRTEDACFYSEIRVSSDVSYAEAKNICLSNEAKMAVIPDVEAYNQIVASVRGKLEGRSYTNLWLGIKINVITGDVIYPTTGGFTQWSRNFPSIGVEYKKHQHVYLFASSNPGMRNSYPSFEHFGVICQI